MERLRSGNEGDLDEVGQVAAFSPTKMLIAYLSTLSLLSAATASSQLFLSSSSAPKTGISLNSQQASAVLASLLDVAHYESIPLAVAAGSRDWKKALEGGDWRGKGSKVVLLIEADQIARTPLRSSPPWPGISTDDPIEQRYCRRISQRKNRTLCRLFRLIPGPHSSRCNSTDSPINSISLSIRLTDFRPSLAASRLLTDGRIGKARNWGRESAGTTYAQRFSLPSGTNYEVQRQEEEKLTVAQMKERPSMASLLTDVNFLDQVSVSTYLPCYCADCWDCRAPMFSSKKSNPCSAWLIRPLLPPSQTTMDRKDRWGTRLSPSTSKDSR